SSHRSFDALDDGGNWAAIVLELLGAVLDAYADAFADVFVVGAFVGILEAAPPAHVIDKDGLEVGFATLDIFEQLFQGVAAIQTQAALALVGIGPDDFDAALGS